MTPASLDMHPKPRWSRRPPGDRARNGAALVLSSLVGLGGGCLARAELTPSRPPQAPSVRVVPAGEIRMAAEWFALSPDGGEVAVLSGIDPWRVHLRRLADGSTRRTLSGPGLALRVLFSPDGSRLAVVLRPPGASRYLRMGSASDGQLLWSADGFSYRGAAAFAPDGRSIAVPEGVNSRIRLLDVETGRALRTLTAVHRVVALLGEGGLGPERVFEGAASDTPYVNDLAFAPNGRAIACAAGAELRFYPAAGGPRAPTRILRSRDGFPLSSLAFSPDGKTIVACGTQGTLRYWVVDDILSSHTALLGAGDLRSLAYSPDGRFIAVASSHTRTAPTDDFIALLSPDDGRLLWRVNAHPGGARCIAFSADSKQLVSAGLDGMIKRWRISSDARGD